MKKKLLTTVLTVGVVLSLVGCGAKETTSNESVAETTEITTEYETEETTEVATEEVATEEVAAEETVVEEETTEAVEETTVEESVAEEVAETAGVPSGEPTVFTDDDPKTSEVADMAEIFGITDYDMYMWKTEDSPMISIYQGTETHEELKEYMYDDEVAHLVKYFATVSTVDGEKDVLLLTDEENTKTVYAYTLGDYTIEISDDMSAIGATYDLQHIVDLIRFE